jgi:hypothetical protein
MDTISVYFVWLATIELSSFISKALDWTKGCVCVLHVIVAYVMSGKFGTLAYILLTLLENSQAIFFPSE